MSLILCQENLVILQKNTDNIIRVFPYLINWAVARRSRHLRLILQDECFARREFFESAGTRPRYFFSGATMRRPPQWWGEMLHAGTRRGDPGDEDRMIE